jgi:epoxyqueuosine reductase
MPGCGTCTRCLAACPTSAFAEPYVLDARRCISYLTIEHRDTFDIELRPLVGRWVYGCDVCQEVCPWQRFANPSGLPELMPFDIERASPRLDRLLALTHQQFDQTYRNSAIHRIGRDKMISNACIAAGNSGQPELSELLIPLLQEPDHVVRSHAAWALGRLGQAATALGRALLTEADDRVQREIKTALKLSS